AFVSLVTIPSVDGKNVSVTIAIFMPLPLSLFPRNCRQYVVHDDAVFMFERFLKDFLQHILCQKVMLKTKVDQVGVDRIIVMVFFFNTRIFDICNFGIKAEPFCSIPCLFSEVMYREGFGELVEHAEL